LGWAEQFCPATPDLDFLCNIEGVVDLDAEVATGTFYPDPGLGGAQLADDASLSHDPDLGLTLNGAHVGRRRTEAPTKHAVEVGQVAEAGRQRDVTDCPAAVLLVAEHASREGRLMLELE
jgi:hypothetical protein